LEHPSYINIGKGARKKHHLDLPRRWHALHRSLKVGSPQILQDERGVAAGLSSADFNIFSKPLKTEPFVPGWSLSRPFIILRISKRMEEWA
jgi:hypothetical protein